MYIHQPNKPHECDKCILSFSCKSRLENHRMIHMGKMPFECEKCGKGYAAKSSLKMHCKKPCKQILNIDGSNAPKPRV